MPPTRWRCAPHTARSWVAGTMIWIKLICDISLFSSGGLLHPSTRPHHKAKTPRKRAWSTMRESKHAKAWQGGWRIGSPLQTPSQNPATSAAPRPKLSTSAPLLKHRNEWRLQVLRTCYFNMYWLKKNKGKEKFSTSFQDNYFLV